MPKPPLDAMVFVVDDDPGVRESLDNLIRANGFHVRTFSSAREFLRCKRPDAPSCLVLDVRLPDISGLELQVKVAAKENDLPIIFITGHGDVRGSVSAMKAGAFEFLTKPFDPAALLQAIKESIECDRVRRSHREEYAKLRQRFGLLTQRERDVFKLVVRGFLNKQIAGELGRAEGTVKVQRSRLMKKLGATSLADLVRISERLIAPPNFFQVRNSECKPKSI